jgi:hypothetical protein
MPRLSRRRNIDRHALCAMHVSCHVDVSSHVFGTRVRPNGQHLTCVCTCLIFTYKNMLLHPYEQKRGLGYVMTRDNNLYNLSSSPSLRIWYVCCVYVSVCVLISTYMNTCMHTCPRTYAQYAHTHTHIHVSYSIWLEAGQKVRVKAKDSEQCHSGNSTRAPGRRP